MCETTDLILKMAHEGKSKADICRALGVSKRSFDDMLSVMPPVTFYPAKTYTVRGFHGTIKQIIFHFELDVGERTVRHRMEDFMSVEEAFFSDKYGRKDTVRGFTGTTISVIKHFGLSITADRVYKRIKAGKTLEEAYFGEIDKSQARNFHKSKQIYSQQLSA